MKELSIKYTKEIMIQKIQNTQFVRKLQLVLFLIYNTFLFWLFVNYKWYYFIPITLVLLMGHLKRYNKSISFGLQVLYYIALIIVGILAIYSIITELIDILTKG